MPVKELGPYQHLREEVLEPWVTGRGGDLQNNCWRTRLSHLLHILPKDEILDPLKLVGALPQSQLGLGFRHGACKCLKFRDSSAQENT